MAWQKGPLPPDTWMWGGVVEAGCETGGFHFADFRGDHVAICSPHPPDDGRVLQAHEVAWFNNALDLPPCCPKGAGRVGA